MEDNLDYELDTTINIRNAANDVVYSKTLTAVKGNYSLSWGGRDNSNQKLPAGIYTVQIFADDKFKNNSELESKDKIQLETDQEPETILTEYKETLYSGKIAAEKEYTHLEKNKINSKQRIWRNLNTIEDNINGLNRSKTKTVSSELDGKIDRLLASKKKK